MGARGTGTSSYIAYPYTGSPQTFGYLKSARAWAKTRANESGHTTIIYQSVGRKTWHVSPDRGQRVQDRVTNPRGGLIPAKLRRMPNGSYKVYVAPGAMAKLNPNKERYQVGVFGPGTLAWARGKAQALANHLGRSVNITDSTKGHKIVETKKPKH